MNYQYNGIGSDGDRNCCFVKALAVVFQTTFADAQQTMAGYGRKRNRPTPWRAIFALLDDLEIDLYYTTTRPTLVRWSTEHDTGTYLIITCNHALVVSDGMVHDSGRFRPRCIVQQFARIL